VTRANFRAIPNQARRTAPEPSAAYSESFTGALSLDKPDELAAYDGV
jgi:hypothetical protein